MMPTNQDDETAMQALIDSQFVSLKCSPTQSADWLIFETGFAVIPCRKTSQSGIG
ncbi:hypothetical protein IQ238_19215 [Pleurocapsales cyanobacterium LEGE 06147]|nr:hypothetical protein [Pleurocapsales cyanobacterium LEGE 06147]